MSALTVEDVCLLHCVCPLCPGWMLLSTPDGSPALLGPVASRLPLAALTLRDMAASLQAWRISPHAPSLARLAERDAEPARKAAVLLNVLLENSRLIPAP